MTVNTIDKAAVERFAHLECAQCGRVWRAFRADTPVTVKGYQAVLITLIAPSGTRRVLYRVKSNGAWHVNGDDSVVIPNATLAQLADAVRVHREAWDKREASRVKARLAREEQAAADRAATRELLVRADTRRAEREAEERAADERERKGMA